jgi:MFS transporter, DHA1 family, tetracycline resistance protein
LDNPNPRAQKRALFVVFLVVFLDLLGVGILVPVTPFLVRPFSTDALTVGLLGFSFSAAQFLASPILGVLSDRYGRRPVLLVSIIGTGIGYLMFGWAGSLLVMYLSRVIDGITGGNIATAQACIADVSAPEDRAKNFGLIGAAFGLGFIIGPAMGGAFSKISLSAPAFAAAGMSLITFVFAWFMLPESLPPERRTKTPFAAAELNPIRQIVAAFGRTTLRTLLFGAVSVNLAMAALQSNFGVFALEVFQVGPGRAAAIFAAIGITGAITQGVIIRRISGKIAEFSIALTGVLLATAGYAGIALAQKEIQLFPTCMLIAAGMGLIGPSVVGLLSKRVSSQEQGSIMGITQSAASLTRTVGPVIAGALYDHVGKTSPYWGGAICVAIGGLLIASARK